MQTCVPAPISKAGNVISHIERFPCDGYGDNNKPRDNRAKRFAQYRSHCKKYHKTDIDVKRIFR